MLTINLPNGAKLELTLVQYLNSNLVGLFAVK
jgi:hypothetical protein